NDVIDAVHIKLLAKIDHSTGLQLKHANRFSSIQKIECVSVIQRDGLKRKFGVKLPDESKRILDNRECLETEEIHLQQAQFGQRPHSILGDKLVVVPSTKRNVIVQGAVTNDNTCCVNAGIPSQAFQNRRITPELLGTLLRFNRVLELRIFVEGGFQRDSQLV